MSPRSVGVEEEFLLLRRDALELAPQGADVVRRASARDDDAQFEQELKQAQAELASEPTTSLADLVADLRALRTRLAGVCAEHGVRLVASGTSPVLQAAETTVKARYHDMMERFGQVAEQQLVCGTHVHVGIESPEEGVRVLDGMAPWLPMLTALSANSPFFAGRETSYASYRSVMWGQWPTAGPTTAFGDVAAYDRLREELVALGAARDDAMIYFTARLSATYPTVEIRACDVCVEADDAVAIAGLARALVEHVAHEAPPPPMRAELLRAASWRAARYGMSDTLVDLVSGPEPRLVPAWQLLDELLTTIAGALEAQGDAAAVHAGLAAIRRRGSGADTQRRVWAATRDFDAVVEAVRVRG